MMDGPRLVVRDISELEAVAVSSEAARNPFVSPNGEWIGYFTERALKKVSIQGGPAITICETSGGARGASWGVDDTIVFATNAPTGLLRVDASGGEPEELTVLGPGESDHFWPEILPGGKALLYTVRSASGMSESRIALLSLDDGSSKTLIASGRSPRYAPTGHVVYTSDDALLAVGFDLTRLVVTTDPVPVGIEDVAGNINGAADIAIAESGSLAYATGSTSSRNRTLAWVDRGGTEEAIAVEPRGYEYVRLSPDGTKLALDVCCDEDENGIWVWDFTRSAMTRLTFDDHRTYYPVWTPDGSRIAFGNAPRQCDEHVLEVCRRHRRGRTSERKCQRSNTQRLHAGWTPVGV